MEFGAKLRKLRIEKGLTQEQLGNELNVHKATISKWEKGRIPDMETLAILCKYFNVKLNFLLGKEEESDLLQAVKHVNSDISQNRAAVLINALIETKMIDENGEAPEEVWATVISAIKKQAKESNNLKEDTNK